MMDDGSRRFWLILGLAAIFVSLILFVAACGGDDEGGSSEETDAPAPSETGDGGGDSGNGGGDDAASDLSELASNYEDFTGVVEYQTTGLGDAFTSMKIYKGENASRVDYVSDETTGTIITTADAIYICGEGACIKYPPGDSSLDPTAGLTALLSADYISDTYGDLPGGVNVDRSSEQIGGVDATCYTYTGDLDETESGDESGSICVSDSGLLLRLEFSGVESGKFEAVDASDTVSDSDFEPPFPVTELPDFGQ